MSEKTAKKEIDVVLDRLGRGEDLPSGWGFDASRNPPVFKVEETQPVTEPDAND